MHDYLFVYDRARRVYPARFRVGGADRAEAEPMNGQIDAAFADDLLEGLRLRFREPGYLVARMSASSWEAVEDNFPGLYRD